MLGVIMNKKLCTIISLSLFAINVSVLSFARESENPNIGDNYLFSVLNHGFYNNYYQVSATCQKIGSDYRIFTEDVRINDICIFPGDPDTILIATSSGLYISYDVGFTWQSINGSGDYLIPPDYNWINYSENELPIQHRAPMNALLHLNENLWWCGNASGPYRTIDAGNSWSIKTRGLPNYRNPSTDQSEYAGINKFAIDSRLIDNSGNEDFFACTNAGILFWLKSKFIDISNGLPKTANGWDHLSVYDVANIADTLFIATELGLYKGVFDIETKMVAWLPLVKNNLSIDSMIYNSVNNSIRLFLNSDNIGDYVNIYDESKSLYWSNKIGNDDGVSFVEINTENLYYSNVDIFDPSSLDFESFDCSNVKIVSSSNKKYTMILIVDRKILSTDNRYMYMLDSQSDFEQVHDFRGTIYDIDIDADNIWVATDKGLFKSLICDLNAWEKITDKINSYSGETSYDYDVRSIALNQSGDLYIGCHNGGLQKKVYLSDNWEKINVGLGHRNLNYTKVDYIAQVFDSIYAQIILKTFLGSIPDTDNDQMMDILILDVQDYYYLAEGDGATFCDGFFNPNDQSDGANSNVSDIIYIDSDPLNLISTEGQAAIVHYLAQSILMSQGFTRDKWILEGLSELAEFLCGLKEPKKYYISLNNSLTIWGDVNPKYKDNEFSYLVFLYMFEHYFNSLPTENYYQSIKALIELPYNGVELIDSCLAKAGYSVTFSDVFNDIARSIVYDQVNDLNLFDNKYCWKNADVSCMSYLLDWGFGEISCPYYLNLKNWAFNIHKTKGFNNGFDWSPDLGDTLTFQGDAESNYKVTNIFSTQDLPASNSVINEMVFNDVNHSWQDISSFGEAEDPYQVLYSVVSNCSNTANADKKTGNYIISNSLNNYFTNPWKFYNNSPLRAYYEFNPLQVYLDWDDVYLSGDKSDLNKKQIEKNQLYDPLKENRLSNRIEPTGPKISSLDGFEGFNVYRSNVMELIDIQQFFAAGDSTIHVFPVTFTMTDFYKAEIEINVKSGFSIFNTQSIYLGEKEIGQLNCFDLNKCRVFSIIISIDINEIIDAIDNQHIVIKVINSASAVPVCDENSSEVLLRLYRDRELISSLQLDSKYIDPGINDNQIFSYKVTAQFNGIETNPTNEVVLRIRDGKNVSKMWVAASNFGTIGDSYLSVGLPSVEWPGGSGTYYLWEGHFWLGSIINEEKRVSQADYFRYEWKPSPSDAEVTRPGHEYSVLGLNTLESTTIYDDLDENIHDTSPQNIKVIQRLKIWPYESENPLLTNTLLINQDIINIGDEMLTDVLAAWVFDCDVGTMTDPTSPAIDDLVGYDGWDGSESYSDEEDFVENIDWNNNGELDGYDEYGIPYGWEHLGSPSIINPNYDLSKIVPDGYPDEFQVIISENDTIVVSRMMAYMYDGDDPASPEDDTGEYDQVRGFIGLRMLYSPSAGIHSYTWENWQNRPNTDMDRYNLMAGNHSNCQGYRWLPDPFRMGASPFDYRFILSTGPFNNFAPYDTINIISGLIMGMGIEGIRMNSDALALIVNKVDIMLPVDEKNIDIPSEYTLYQNYPNPFNPSTIFRYSIPVKSDVELAVFDLTGRQIVTLVDKVQQPGQYTIQWNASNIPSGVYLYRIQAGNFQKVKKSILIK